MVLVLVMADVLCSRARFVLAVGGRRSPAELEWQEHQQKGEQQVAHSEGLAVDAL